MFVLLLLSLLCMYVCVVIGVMDSSYVRMLFMCGCYICVYVMNLVYVMRVFFVGVCCNV